MRVRVKICGVTTDEGVEAAARHGVDAVGFVFAESPRRVDPLRAVELAAALPPCVTRVAVFHHPDPDEVDLVVARFAPDVVQCEPDPAVLDRVASRARFLAVLHDDATAVERAAALRADGRYGSALLFEAAGRGGRGVAPDRSRAARLAAAGPLALAGGLDPASVAGAIRDVRPWAVDVSSGVERAPGQKDAERIRRFVEAVRLATERAEEESR